MRGIKLVFIRVLKEMRKSEHFTVPQLHCDNTPSRLKGLIIAGFRKGVNLLL
jgi:hypothetical protein